MLPRPQIRNMFPYTAPINFLEIVGKFGVGCKLKNVRRILDVKQIVHVDSDVYSEKTKSCETSLERIMWSVWSSWADPEQNKRSP